MPIHLYTNMSKIHITDDLDFEVWFKKIVLSIIYLNGIVINILKHYHLNVICNM